MTIIDDKTVSVTATYDEPTTNQDGTPLTDLAYTEVEFRVGTNPAETLEPKAPASAPTGGGHIVSAPFILQAPAGAVTVFTFDVFAVDTAGNRSPVSATVTETVDRIGPSAPQNFTVG
jgi:hypothetical protein